MNQQANKSTRRAQSACLLSYGYQSYISPWPPHRTWIWPIGRPEQERAYRGPREAMQWAQIWHGLSREQKSAWEIVESALREAFPNSWEERANGIARGVMGAMAWVEGRLQG